MSDEHEPFCIVGARVFDGERLIGDPCVTVAAGHIVDVGAPPSRHHSISTVDGSRATLLPGLIDAHCHAGPGCLEQALAFGVTTAFDLFNDAATSASLRNRAATRRDLADVRTAGVGATVADGHPVALLPPGLPPVPTVDAPNDAEAFVQTRVAEGSDLLKLFVDPGAMTGVPLPALDATTVAALTSAARGRGLQSVAHALDADSARVAAEGGVDGLAHVFADRRDPALVARIAALGVFVVPTLVMIETMCGRSRAEELLTDPWITSHLDVESRTTLETSLGAPENMGLPASPHPEGSTVAQSVVEELHRDGVTILAGSDALAGFTAHGASLHRELELLVDAGLSPTEALRAATANPADQLRVPDRGRIAPGLRADLVLVEGDPTTTIHATRRIRATWRQGVPVIR